jgi:hypothetical protein
LDKSVGLFFLFAVIGYSIWFFYLTWFQPDKYTGSMRKIRRFINSKIDQQASVVRTILSFPRATNDYLNNHNNVSIWYARIFSLVCLVLILISGFFILLALFT